MLTIVTINHNNAPGLRRTIDSVLAQSQFKFVEHVIIDNDSSDGSKDIIQNYAKISPNVIWRSELDSGIYNAMNKGLKLANRAYVTYLNSGDVLSNEYVFQKIQSRILNEEGPDILYCDIILKNTSGEIKRRWRSGKFNRLKLYLGWMPPHPMFIAKKKIIFFNRGFNEKFKIAGDYDLMLRMLLNNEYSVDYIDEYLVNMELGGRSNGSMKDIIKANLEVLGCWRDLNGFVPYWVFIMKPLSKLSQLFRIG